MNWDTEAKIIQDHSDRFRNDYQIFLLLVLQSKTSLLCHSYTEAIQRRNADCKI